MCVYLFNSQLFVYQQYFLTYKRKKSSIQETNGMIDEHFAENKKISYKESTFLSVEQEINFSVESIFIKNKQYIKYITLHFLSYIARNKFL